MNRERFLSKPGREPKPLKLEVGGFAELSLKMMREIAKSYHDRSEILDTRIVRLNKYHLPTQAYLVDFEHLYGTALWVNAEDLKPTQEEWKTEKPPLQNEDPYGMSNMMPSNDIL